MEAARAGAVAPLALGATLSSQGSWRLSSSPAIWRNGPAGAVDQEVWQDDCRRHIGASVASKVADHCGHAGQVVRRRPVRVKPGGSPSLPVNINVVAETSGRCWRVE